MTRPVVMYVSGVCLDQDNVDMKEKQEKKKRKKGSNANGFLEEMNLGDVTAHYGTKEVGRNKLGLIRAGGGGKNEKGKGKQL